MNRRKVAMVADFPLSGQKIDGGVQAVTAYLVEAIRQLDEVDLHIVSFSSRVTAPVSLEEDGLPILLLPRHRLATLTRFRGELRDFRRALERIRPDMVHGQGAGIEGYVSVRSGLPSLVTIHGIIREDARYQSTLEQRLRFRMLSKITENYCVHHAPHTILISPYVREYYGSRLRGEHRYISNPVRPDFYNIERRERKGNILFAGRLIPRKGVIDLVRAVALVRADTDVELLLAGSTDDTMYFNQIMAEIDRLGIKDCVKVLGLLDETTLREQFAECAALVLPSYQETAPMVVQQAMAARIPVIATAICGVPCQLDYGESGLLHQPGDVAALAAHIRSLLRDDRARQVLAQRGRVKAEAEFHAKVVARQTVDYYKDILSGQ